MAGRASTRVRCLDSGRDLTLTHGYLGYADVTRDRPTGRAGRMGRLSHTTYPQAVADGRQRVGIVYVQPRRHSARVAGSTTGPSYATCAVDGAATGVAALTSDRQRCTIGRRAVRHPSGAHVAGAHRGVASWSYDAAVIAPRDTRHEHLGRLGRRLGPARRLARTGLAAGTERLPARPRCGLPRRSPSTDQNVSYFGKRLPRLWPSPTRSGSSSAWSPRRCRPCSTSREDIKVVVDMTASV